MKFRPVMAIFAALVATSFEADEIAPGTTVIVTEAPAVRKPVVDSDGTGCAV
jgi:hypothetical protein